MQYVTLGNTGVRVSRICIGTAALGVAPREEDAPALFNRALDLGINFFDTANSYGDQPRFSRPGAPPAEQRKSAEEILGLALKGHRHDVIIASKVQERVLPGPNGGGTGGGGLTRVHIMRMIERTLKRLRTDYLDLYYWHAPDPSTPIDQTLRAMDDLVRQGKIRYFALSNFPAWQMTEIVMTSRMLGLYEPVATQMRYSMAARAIEEEVVHACRRFGLGLTCYSPLAGGLLTGLETLETRAVSILGDRRWLHGQGPGFNADENNAARQLDAVAKEWELPPAQLALGWLLSRPAVTSAVIGPENLEELEQNASAGDLRLTREQLDILEPIGAKASI